MRKRKVGNKFKQTDGKGLSLARKFVFTKRMQGQLQPSRWSWDAIQTLSPQPLPPNASLHETMGDVHVDWSHLAKQQKILACDPARLKLFILGERRSGPWEGWDWWCWRALHCSQAWFTYTEQHRLALAIKLVQIHLAHSSCWGLPWGKGTLYPKETSSCQKSSTRCSGSHIGTATSPCGGGGVCRTGLPKAHH